MIDHTLAFGMDGIKQQWKSHSSSGFGFCSRDVVHVQWVAELSLHYSWFELVTGGELEPFQVSSKDCRVTLVGAEGDEGGWKVSSHVIR